MMENYLNYIQLGAFDEVFEYYGIQKGGAVHLEHVFLSFIMFCSVSTKQEKEKPYITRNE
jgi:hypothetical protein